jgi:hypothetical protein
MILVLSYGGSKHCIEVEVSVRVEEARNEFK